MSLSFLPSCARAFPRDLPRGAWASTAAHCARTLLPVALIALSYACTPSGASTTSAHLSADSQQADPQAAQALSHTQANTSSTALPTSPPSPELLADPVCAPYAAMQDQPLLDALYEATRGHRVLGYALARDHMYGRREPVIDIFDGMVECVYTGRLATPDGTRTPEDMNTEHTWPRSKGSREGPALSDLHHLFIT